TSGRALADRRRARLPCEDSMNAASPSPLLPTVLRVFGLIFIFGIVILNRVWPSGWAWQPEQPAYLQMILGIYVTLGVFLLLAARDPMRNLSLIWFTMWSSVVHAGVMAYHSITDPGQRGHLWGDVAASLAALIETERACCPFLSFQLIVEPDRGSVSLELTGPAGTREFLEAELGLGPAS